MAGRARASLLVLVLVIGALGVVSSDASASTSGVVISQVYGGGGTTGSLYANDFIELHNTGSTPVDVTGWSVEYASSTGTTFAATNLGSAVIAPGGFLLVAEGSGGGAAAPLPTPDVSGTINMSSTAGKVRLMTGTSVLDLVGYGTGTTAFEGSGPAPAPSATLSIVRTGSGCTDTDNNATDFVTSSPVPHNSASTPVTCGGSPEPPPSASASQSVTATITEAAGGVLSISVAQPTVDFGEVTQGANTGPVPVGDVLFTNTLNNGAAWSTTVAATSLVSGGNSLPFTALTFSPGSTITPDISAVGTPAAGSPASFSGADPTPGTSFSDPVTLSTAQPSAQGSYTQSDSTVSLAAPASQPAGSYAGTLQYTILAGPTT